LNKATRSAMMIILVAFFAQAFAQELAASHSTDEHTAIDKLTKRALDVQDLGDADLDLTTLGKGTAVLPRSALLSTLMVYPVAAQLPDARARPGEVFQLGKIQLEGEGAPAPAPAKAEGGEAPKPAKKKVPKVDLPGPEYWTPQGYVKKDLWGGNTVTAMNEMQEKSQFAKELLEVSKANCFYKNCGSKFGEGFSSLSFDMISAPAVVLISLVVGSGITLAVHWFRQGASTTAMEAFLA